MHTNISTNKIKRQHPVDCKAFLLKFVFPSFFFSPFAISTLCHLLLSFHLFSIKLADHTHLPLAADSPDGKKNHITDLK